MSEIKEPCQKDPSLSWKLAPPKADDPTSRSPQWPTDLSTPVIEVWYARDPAVRCRPDVL